MRALLFAVKGIFMITELFIDQGKAQPRLVFLLDTGAELCLSAIAIVVLLVVITYLCKKVSNVR